MKLCILVAVSSRSLLTTLTRIYDDNHNNEIRLFLYNDGVLLVQDPAFMELIKHMQAIMCSVSADERRIQKNDGVTSGSLYDFSRMIAASDRLISFTRES